jgi:hypothetical protein
MSRPKGNNADEWHLFLCEYLDSRANGNGSGLTYMAVQVAEALDEQIAEAVAAERERILAAWVKCSAVLDEFLDDADHFELADDGAVDISDASKAMAEFARAIREGGKPSGGSQQPVKSEGA